MTHLFKAKLSLAGLGVFAAVLSHVYFAGVDAGARASDDDAFAAYVHFAKPMQHETHRVKLEKIRAKKPDSVWAVLDGRG